MAELDGRQSLVSQYVVELQDLTFNSKPLINTLTMIASENPQASSGIAEAIERRIASVCCLLVAVNDLFQPYSGGFPHKQAHQLQSSEWYN